MAFELGIFHFGELIPDPTTHVPPRAGHRLRELIEQATAADEVGLDVFAVGEHHRTDFAVSTPAVVLSHRTEPFRVTFGDVE
jgi:alkanesulfonate monooxygenase SsuD/methylene tetrahydromethanopterin reductase-like flavin-dependent oxidoreductase (luciferase family)